LSVNVTSGPMLYKFCIYVEVWVLILLIPVCVPQQIMLTNRTRRFLMFQFTLFILHTLTTHRLYTSVLILCICPRSSMCPHTTKYVTVSSHYSNYLQDSHKEWNNLYFCSKEWDVMNTFVLIRKFRSWSSLNKRGTKKRRCFIPVLHKHHACWVSRHLFGLPFRSFPSLHL
jgi:hypothetical protein